MAASLDLMALDIPVNSVRHGRALNIACEVMATLTSPRQCYFMQQLRQRQRMRGANRVMLAANSLTKIGFQEGPIFC
jgi:hypothetical protein